MSYCVRFNGGAQKHNTHTHTHTHKKARRVHVCRLEQLLALGSLTIKEESGYVAFFHHLLEPYKHYVPFYVRVRDTLHPLLCALRCQHPTLLAA